MKPTNNRIPGLSQKKLIVISMLPFTAEKEIFVIQSCKQ